MVTMKVTFLTIFPESFDSFLDYPVIRRAVGRGLVDIEVVDVRDFASGCFRAVDDSPYGGGAGLLLRVDTLCSALASVAGTSSRTILLGPKGRPFCQRMAHELARQEHLILVAGHYEGVDERFRSHIDDEISIGDYILTGGESAAIVVAEAVIRLLDGALRDASTKEESFESGLLEYPQYTHPAVHEGRAVPDVLTSGDRKRIARFNEMEAVRDTARLRPDLLAHDRKLEFFFLHRDAGGEAEVIRWLDGRLPVPAIAWEDGGFLLLDRLKGRSLRTTGRSRKLKTCAAVLRMLWSLDASDCPVRMDNASVFSRLRKKEMSYDLWCRLRTLEMVEPEEVLVFSHGSLTLDSIIVNGNGIVGMVGLQKAGVADRYRDLASILSSLEEEGVEGSELIGLLGIDVDEDRLDFFRQLGRLDSGASG